MRAKDDRSNQRSGAVLPQRAHDDVDRDRSAVKQNEPQQKRAGGRRKHAVYGVTEEDPGESRAVVNVPKDVEVLLEVEKVPGVNPRVEGADGLQEGPAVVGQYHDERKQKQD